MGAVEYETRGQGRPLQGRETIDRHADSEHAVATIPGARSLVPSGGTDLACCTHDDATDAQACALAVLSG